MKKLSKLFSIFLFAFLTVVFIKSGTITSFAARSGKTGDCTWSLNGTVLTISGNGAMGNYDYYSRSPWGTSITEVIIEDGVKTIGSYAFYNCDGLTSITIPDSVTTIGSSAFEDCTSLTSVTIGDSVTTIGDEAFASCEKLTSITLPDSVTTIGSLAFYNCDGLTSIEVPDSVTIGGSAFNNTGYYNNPYNWEDNVLYLGNHLIEAKETISGEYIIKSGTKTIAEYAFDSCDDLTNVTIGDSVTTIGYGAFYGCSSLQNITLPFVGSSRDANESTDAVFGYIFGYSSSSGNGRTLQYYKNGEYNYYYIPSNLKSVTITDDGTIPYGAFYGCSGLTSVSLSDSVTTIGSSAFYGCSGLISIEIPDSVTTIGGSAFSNTGYYNNPDNWEDNVLYLGNHLIKAKETISGEYIIKSGTKTIAEYAFDSCDDLTNVTIGDSVTTIGSRAFYGCKGLTSITIPDSVTTIGSSAFYGCSGLTKITIPFVGRSLDGTENTHFGYIFGAYGYYGNESYVPSSLKEVVITRITTIPDNALYGCSSLTSVTIPDSVTSIGNSAFYGCSNLTTVNIPDSVTSIGDSAFYGCSNLTTVNIPDSVTTIGGSAFYNCTGLAKITLPFVGQNADGTGFSNFGYIFGADDESYPYFHNVEYVPSSLKNVVVTGSNSIAGYAFYGCNNLQSVTFCGDVKILGGWVFGDCIGLRNVTLPASCIKIGAMTFYDCLNLESVYFLGSEAQRNIEIDHGNDMLEDVATWHYNSCYGVAEHTYDNDRDTDCNVCGDKLEVKSGWENESGNWYYYVNGVKQTGWVSDNGIWYYLNSDGVMQTGWLKSGNTWYYLKDSGAMATGWANVNGTYYYFNGSGAMQTGWLKLGNTWYYLKDSGAMATGSLKIGNKWYRFNSSGAWIA